MRVLRLEKNQQNIPFQTITRLEVFQHNNSEVVPRDILIDAELQPSRVKDLQKRHHHRDNDFLPP